MNLRHRYYLNVSDRRILCGANMDNLLLSAGAGVVLCFPTFHKQGQFWGEIVSNADDMLNQSGDNL